MVGNGTKSLRTAAGLALFLALALAAATAWALVLPRESGESAPPIAAMAAAILSGALLLCVVRLFLLARGLSDGSSDSTSDAGHEPMAAPAPAIQPAAPPKPSVPDAASATQPGSEALMLLTLLQEKGRFVDFVMDDIAAYTNEQVGAAARVVHQGCREVVAEAFSPLPVSPVENARITLEPGYDAAEFRLVGRASAPTPLTAPFTVKVAHKGWRARHVKLPRSIKAGKIPESPIIVPAEVAA